MFMLFYYLLLLKITLLENIILEFGIFFHKDT